MGISASSLAQLLQSQHEEYVSADAVYNAFQKVKKAHKAGRTDTQVMLDQLKTPHEV